MREIGRKMCVRRYGVWRRSWNGVVARADFAKDGDHYHIPARATVVKASAAGIAAALATTAAGVAAAVAAAITAIAATTAVVAAAAVTAAAATTATADVAAVRAVGVPAKQGIRGICKSIESPTGATHANILIAAIIKIFNVILFSIR